MKPILPLVLTLSTLCGSIASAASSEYATAMEEGRRLLDALDVEGARSAFAEAYTAANTGPERGRALDAMGIAHGIDAAYWRAFRSFFRAVGEGVELDSVNHPQIPTRKMAVCAAKLAKDMTLGEAEAALRASVSATPSDNLDAKLASALFGERFACPDPEPDIPAPPQVSSPAPSEADGSPTLVEEPRLDDGGGPPTMTWVLGATAVVAGGASAAFGLLSLDAAENAEAQTFNDDISDAESMATASNVALGVAGGALVGAVLFWVLDGDGSDDGHAGWSVAPNGAMVRF